MFFQQEQSYGVLTDLVGSEIFIRDRLTMVFSDASPKCFGEASSKWVEHIHPSGAEGCLVETYHHNPS